MGAQSLFTNRTGNLQIRNSLWLFIGFCGFSLVPASQRGKKWRHTVGRAALANQRSRIRLSRAIYRTERWVCFEIWRGKFWEGEWSEYLPNLYSYLSILCSSSDFHWEMTMCVIMGTLDIRAPWQLFRVRSLFGAFTGKVKHYQNGGSISHNIQ